MLADRLPHRVPDEGAEQAEARIAAARELIEAWQREADDATACRLGTGRRAALLGCVRALRAALETP